MVSPIVIVHATTFFHWFHCALRKNMSCYTTHNCFAFLSICNSWQVNIEISRFIRNKPESSDLSLRMRLSVFSLILRICENALKRFIPVGFCDESQALLDDRCLSSRSLESQWSVVCCSGVEGSVSKCSGWLFPPGLLLFTYCFAKGSNRFSSKIFLIRCRRIKTFCSSKTFVEWIG